MTFPNAIADEKQDVVDAIRGMEFTNDDNDDTGLKPIAIEQACKDNGGEWKENIWCKFDKDKTGDEVEFEHQLEDRGLMYYYDDSEEAGFSDEWEKYEQEKYEKSQKGAEEYEKYVTEQEIKDAEELAKMTNSKTFENFVESKGIDIDDDYHWLSAQEQEEIETEFKEDKSDDYEAEINKDELKQTEEEPVIEDWKNEVKVPDYNEKPTIDYAGEEEEEEPEQEEEEQEEEPEEEEEDNSDSESEQDGE